MSIDFIPTAKKVLELEGKAILNLISSLNDQFNLACQKTLSCQGKVIVTGMGKSGHIAKKTAATLASTGTAAFFLHPAEACHGDLGMISQQDLVLIFSNSGETDELITIIPALKRFGISIIAITGNANSKIAKHADVHLQVAIAQEACPLNLAPTTSTTCALAMGDALAVSILNARQFSSHDFARYHPAGRLGKRLLLTIADIMHINDKIPLATPDEQLPEAIMQMSSKCFGLLAIVDHKDHRNIQGVFSDGDLRRVIDKKIDLTTTKIAEVMTKQFKFIEPKELAIKAVELMEQFKIFSLPVVDNGKIVGIFNMHDLLKAGIL